MNRLKNFIKTSIIGGVSVILPTALLFFIFRWFFRLVTDIIQPMTNLVISKSQLQEFVADIVVIFLMLTACFVVGAIVKTTVGRFIQENLENRILKIAPGYSIIRETVLQFLGKKASPFSKVALIQAYENDTLMTGFITDEHQNGLYSVFVPTGPNPTTGYILHLKPQYVHQVDVPVEDTIRSIISCGAGSSDLIDAYKKQTKPSV